MSRNFGKNCCGNDLLAPTIDLVADNVKCHIVRMQVSIGLTITDVGEPFIKGIERSNDNMI